MYTDIALKVYTAICDGIIKSRSSFWRDFSSIEKINSLNLNCSKYKSLLDSLAYNITCYFDEDFPAIDANVPNNEMPFLFAYNGNINLIKDISKNIAVIGVLTPNDEIALREKRIISSLIKNNICIVSGLARGCDSIAHSECLKSNGKTIAFLPSTIDKIYPTENANLAENIVANGGLIITEFVTEPKNYNETISRFIDRDRLQAMFSNSIILIASYRKGEGDSGSRHAMAKAKKYNRQRFVMYNNDTDKGDAIFGLNEELIKDGARVLTQNNIKEIIN